MKKIWTGLLAACCTVTLLAGCTGNQTEVTSDPQASTTTDTPTSTTQTASTWYEIDKDLGVLTVRLPSEDAWDFAIADPSVLELLTQETTAGEYVASFRALADGQTQLVLQNATEERALEVVCAGGKVSSATVIDAAQNIGIQDDAQIAALRQTNNLRNLLQTHHTVTRVSEQWDGEDVWQLGTVTQFTKNNGYLCFEEENSDESGNVVYSRAGYIDQETPGAYYEAADMGMKYMQLYPSSEYEAFIEELWLRRNTGDYETVQEQTTDEEHGTTVITTRRKNDVTEVYSDVVYFVDTQSGLITGMEETEYDWETGKVIGVTRSNILYDEPRELQQRAAMTILGADDPCYLTLVINPGQANEEEQAFRVDKMTQVEFEALEAFELYYDYDCTQPMEWIDVGQNKLTVYAVLKP